MWLWYLSHRRPEMAQASLRIRTVSPEPSLFAHMKYGSRRRKSDIYPHWIAVNACLKNECTKDEKCHNPMRWLKHWHTSWRPTHRPAPSYPSEVITMLGRTVLTKTYRVTKHNIRQKRSVQNHKNPTITGFRTGIWKNYQSSRHFDDELQNLEQDVEFDCVASWSLPFLLWEILSYINSFISLYL